MSEEKPETDLEKIAEAAAAVQNIASNVNALKSENLRLLKDVNLTITVELGRTKLSIQDILQFGQGSVIELEKLAGEPLDIYVNGKLIARGEAVIVNEKFGVRITDIVSTDDRLSAVR